MKIYKLSSKLTVYRHQVISTDRFDHYLEIQNSIRLVKNLPEIDFLAISLTYKDLDLSIAWEELSSAESIGDMVGSPIAFEQKWKHKLFSQIVKEFFGLRKIYSDNHWTSEG